MHSVSAWAPLRRPMYRALWLSNSISQVGTWMQIVGAQWLMGSLAGTSLEVALVQTATTLPYFLVALPAGAIGDILDRRKVLIAAQVYMSAGAAVLVLLTLTGEIEPWSLLALIFWIGLGQGLMGPSWQAVQPELVPRSEIREAAVLGGMSVNLARAVGPALGGAVVAALGAAWTFAFNAASFFALLAALVVWKRPAPDPARLAEPFHGALRAGARYFRSARRLRSIVARSLIFGLAGSGLWALLPILARDQLRLGSAGYGLLLAAVGVGAVLSAAILPRFRAHVAPGRIVAYASTTLGVSCVVAAWVSVIPLVAAALVVAGASWIGAISSMTGAAQTVLPSWVRSRGMAVYLMSVLGSQALGAAIWGSVAQAWGVTTAFTVMAAALAAGVIVGLRWPIETAISLDLSPPPPPPVPVWATFPGAASVPVRVETTYRVPEAAAMTFALEMQRVGLLRRRTGAVTWALYRDGIDPERFVEVYDVRSWDEHVRQRTERQTISGQDVVQGALRLTVDGVAPETRYLFGPR